MPDDNGTETTRSDAPSVDESLFGEAAEDTEAAVADEQDAERGDPNRTLTTPRRRTVRRRP